MDPVHRKKPANDGGRSGRKASGKAKPAAGGERAAAPLSPAQVVKKLLKDVGLKLGEGGVKATLSDYIKLLQLHKELDAEEPREITVTWVDSEERKKELESEWEKQQHE